MTYACTGSFQHIESCRIIRFCLKLRQMAHLYSKMTKDLENFIRTFATHVAYKYCTQVKFNIALVGVEITLTPMNTTYCCQQKQIYILY